MSQTHLPAHGKSITEDSIAFIENLIQDDNLHDTALDIDHPMFLLPEIVKENLGYRKLSSLCVPKQLNEEQLIRYNVLR